MRNPRFGTPLLAATLALVFTIVSAQSDDPFLRTLTRDEPLDRTGMARYLIDASANLVRERDGVALMRELVEAGAPDKPYAVRASRQIQERYELYRTALERFASASRSLGQAPSSPSRMFRTVVAGQRACWLLESQVNLAESYGANVGRLSSVLASSDSCATFHHVAFQPRVQRAIEQALADDRTEPELRRENRILKEELKALERLLEDLRAIDGE